MNKEILMTVLNKLTTAIYAALPRIVETKLSKDLRSVHPDPNSKSDAVTFEWRNSRFRMTKALKVKEYDFMGKLVETELAKEAEALIRAKA